MGFGFPASYSETRNFGFQSEESVSVVKSVLDDLGWDYETLTNNEFAASLPVNLASWGEEINVAILSNGLIEVESKCAYPLQCFDWGKNKENVLTFFGQIEVLKNWQIQSSAFENIPLAFDERGYSPVERVFSEMDNE